MNPTLYILGNFPPPINGQNIQTERNADLLSSDYEVVRIDTSLGGSRLNDASTRLSRLRHYSVTRSKIRHAIGDNHDAPVVWHTISPNVAGHVRDRIITFPPIAANPVHAVVHWGNFEKLFQQSLTRHTGGQLIERLKSIVFLDKSLADRCSKWIDDSKIRIVQNTIDDAILVSQSELDRKQTTVSSRDVFRILFVANMIASKGYEDVLDAIPILKNAGHKVHLDLAGIWASETDELHFNNKVVSLGVEDSVTHHGAIAERQRLKQLYLEADAFVLPTYYPTEAQPLSIIEALNAGTPIITTRHAGIPSMVDEGSEALFVDSRSPGLIAARVEDLLDVNRWNAMSGRARRRFELRFSPDVVRRSWMELLA